MGEYFFLVYTHHVCTLGTKEGEKRGVGGGGRAELKVTVNYGV